jgi:hypothetical protein
MITANAIRGHVFFLASDALEGRYVGSEGYEIAASYGASQFRAAGLVPGIQADDSSSYLQKVPVLRRKATGEFKLIVTTPHNELVFSEGEDFIWLQGEVFPWEGRHMEPVYVGYGISEPDFGWDDLDGVDIKGKVAVMRMGAPMRNDGPVLPEEVHALYAPPSAVFRKMVTLMLRGAAGILIIPDPMILEGWETLPSKLATPQFEYDNTTEGSLHVPFLCPVKPAVADALFAGQGYAPHEMTDAGEEAPHDLDLGDVRLTMTGSFTEEEIPTWNVVGMVEGTDPALKNRYVVITAHLDSTAPRETGEINNGADDNASGSAGLIEIAKVVAVTPPRRSVVFVLTSGEEAACIGSRHFVSDCPVLLEDIVADVNMDMIGRTADENLADRSHYAIDSEKITPLFTELIKDVNTRTINWPLEYSSPIGTSDNLMFHAVDIPAVSFYSGHHADVNRPTDDPEKLDYEKAEKIARLVYEITMELGNRATLWP